MNQNRTKICGNCKYWKRRSTIESYRAFSVGICTPPLPFWVDKYLVDTRKKVATYSDMPMFFECQGFKDRRKRRLKGYPHD